DEVVAAAKRTQLTRRLAEQVLHFRREVREFIHQRLGILSELSASPGHRPVVLGEADGNGTLDRGADCSEAVRKMARRQRGWDGAHSTADVNADGRGRNGVLHGDDAAHRGALTEVNVRHDRDVVERPRQRSDVAELVQRAGLYLVQLRPEMYVD